MSNRLQQTHQFLTHQLIQDPQWCLAMTVATWDPLWQMRDEDWADEPEYVLPTALQIIRSVFPDLYVDAIQALRQGQSQTTVEQQICDGITRAGIPIDEIESVLYGIPIPAYGIDLEDPDFFSLYPDFKPILSCFGGLATPSEVTLPPYIHTTVYALAENLQQQEECHLKQVSWLLGHLFSCTGNSSVDWTLIDMDGIEWLTWDEENVAFAMAIIEEAHDILQQATEGLVWCQAHPEFLTILKHNFQHTYTRVKQGKGQTDDLQLDLDWHTA